MNSIGRTAPRELSERCVLITGTTSGVGRALLEYYVSAGAQVVAVNRRSVPELAALYPTVRFECVDVTAANPIAELMKRLSGSGSLPDLLILNAGINRVDNDAHFELDEYRAVVETNLFGVLNFVQPLMQLCHDQVPRHIVAISSMANYIGNPYALGYHTSKRALTACFDAWSRMYSGTHLSFQQVMLGPVHTSIYTMAAELPDWMVQVKDAFSATPADTARAIAHFARTHQRRLYYPKRTIPLYVGMGLLRTLIPGFFAGRKTLAGKTRRAPRAPGGK